MKKLLIFALTLGFGLWALDLPAQNTTTNNPGVPIFGTGGTSSGLQFVFVNGLGQVAYPANFWTANSSNGLMGLTPINNTVYVSTNGNDTTAMLGRAEFPAATFARANQLAFPVQGTVVVEPGTYFANNILTNGVNYFFSTGSTVVWNVPSTNTVSDYWAIFDDRTTGPTTNKIFGYGDFKWQGYTNFITSSGMTTGSSNQNLSGMCGGVLVETNPASSITINANSMQGSSWTELGAAIITAAYGNLTVNINWMADPAAYTNLVFTNTVAHTTVNKASSVIGITWNNGIQHIYCRSNAAGNTGTRQNGYALWGNGFAPTDLGDFYYEGDFLGGKIYTSFQTTNSVWWVHIKRDENLGMIGFGTPTQMNPLSMFGSQKGYIYADKMASASPAWNIAPIDTSVQSGTSNTMLWAYIGKLVCSNILYNGLSGTGWTSRIYLNVAQVEDLSGGGATNGNSAGLILNYLPGPDKLGAFFLTNPIVYNGFWTNTTGMAGTLTMDYSEPAATASIGITNISNGEWFNGTNATGSFRTSLAVKQMDIICVSNKNGSPTLDASRFSP